MAYTTVGRRSDEEPIPGVVADQGDAAARQMPVTTPASLDGEREATRRTLAFPECLRISPKDLPTTGTDSTRQEQGSGQYSETNISRGRLMNKHKLHQIFPTVIHAKVL